MKIKALLLLVFYLLILQVDAQTTYNINTVNGTTVTSCNAILYDSGGPAGTYQNNENYTVTFCSGTTDCLQLQFLGNFSVESGWDYLYIHDGNSTGANLLATLAGNTLPGTITTSGNCVTIHFTTDGSVTYDGFQIGITCTGSCYVPPPPPTNDDPCTAFNLTVNASCNYTQYTCQAATGTTVVPAPSCGFNYMGGDVWFSAVVPASGAISVLLGPAFMNNAGIAIYSGPDCNTLTEIACNEPWSGMPPVQTLGGLAGQTIWIRVWDPDNDNPGTFNICAYIPPPPPTNDDPCTALSINVNSSCNFSQFTCQSATGTVTVPPPSCAFSYAGGDVWFSAVVPASGLLAVQLGALVMNEAGIAIYSGPDCNNLTQISCEEQTWATMPSAQYIGSTLGLAGQTVWIRVWEPDNDNADLFNICAFEPPPFLEIDTISYTPTQLVQDILVTGCLTATNVTHTGTNSQIGYFNNGNAVGFQNGVILSSGNASDAFGAGNSTFASNSFFPGNGSPDFANSFDASILEFDFIPSSDTMRFNFVFGSEEYPEFANSSYNDPFGFFITGPNPVGPAYANTNIALIPGTTTPITINSLNNGSSSPPTGPCMNCAYYIDNYSGTYPITYDGFTTALTAWAVVTPCQVYHIKMVVADVADHSFDSAVLLEAGSFSSGGQVAFNHHSSMSNVDEVLEGCDNFFVFSRLDTLDLTDSILVQLNISGNAINGVDYSNIPTTFWLSAGVISDTIYYNAILDNIAEATEYLVISLTNGCPCNTTTVSDTIYFIDNFSLNAGISNDTLVCSGQPVTIYTSVNPLIDVTLLHYNWSTGDTLSSISVNPSTPTTYYVTINDPCAQDTVMECTVTIVPPMSPAFSILKDTVCINEITTISFTGTAGPSAIYQWDFSGGNPATANTAGPHNVSWATAGTKPISFSIDDNGCTGDSIQNVVVLPFPQITLTPSPASCFGTATGSITTTETGQITPYNYTWSNGSANQNPTNLIAGTYSVTASNAYACSSTASTTITEPTILTLSTSFVDVSCYGASDGSATATVNGGTQPYSYLWNDALNQINQTASNLTAGNYIVTVTDANGCSLSSTAIISQPASSLSVTAQTSDVSCFGLTDGEIEVVVLGGTSPHSYSWSNGSTTALITDLIAGNYTITVSDANGCTLSQSWLIIEPLALTHSNVTTNASCFGTSDGSVALTVNNGTPPYIYHWSNNANGSTLSGVNAGVYSVTVTDSHNCSFIDTYQITQPQKVFVSTTGNQSICLGQSATIDASVTGGTSPYVLHWNNGSNQTSIVVSPTAETVYQLYATDANQCQSNTVSVTISVNPVITATYNISSSSICLGEGITITINANGGNGVYSYLLDGVLTTLPFNLFPSQSHTYSIVVNDECGSPSASLQVPVVVKPLPPVNYYADVVEGCVPLTVHFIEVNSDNGQTYLWNFGDDSYNETSTEKNPIHTFENDGVYDVDLEVISADGCKNHFTQVDWITVYPQPESHFTAEPRITSFIKPNVHFINLSSIQDQSYWYFGDGDSSQTTNPWHTFPALPGIYDVSLVIQSEYGCLDTSYLPVQITDVYTFYAPTAFSPDNDGKNDYFFVSGHGITEQTFTMQIYDRWGGIVWSTEAIDGKWDGNTISGKKAPVGTYTWLVHYKDETGIAHEYSGPVTLIR